MIDFARHKIGTHTYQVGFHIMESAAVTVPHLELPVLFFADQTGQAPDT
jgi:hypothetical protein